MDARYEVLQKLREHLPFGMDSSLDLREDLILTDLGLTSLHLLTLVMTLQEQYGLDVDQLTETGMPVTLGDLITMMELGLGRT